ncbi:MAG: transposase [Chthoniobacter sp.]
MPRRTHALKNAAASERFQRTLARELWALGVPKEKPVRVWAIDEHRYGLISHQRRCWGMRRVRAYARYRTKYEWGYVATALEIAGPGEGLCVFFPTVNQEVSTRFLEQISQTDPEAVHVILQDRAGFHLRQGAAELPANVRLLPLPAYSPELNPVERVGGLIRTATANRVFVDLPAMEAAIQEALRPLWTDPSRVRSLIGEGWLLAQVNAFSS